MTGRDLVRTSVSNLGRHKARTILTAFGVLVGILALVSMVSLGVGIQREIVRSARAIGLETVTIQPQYQGEEDPYNPLAERQPQVPLTPDLVERIQAMPGVASVRAGLWLPYYLRLQLRIGERWGPAYLSGRADQAPFEAAPQLLYGRTLAPEDRRGLVLTTGLLERTMKVPKDCLKELVGKEVALVAQLPQGELVEFPVEVVGVLDTRQVYVLLGVEEVLRINEWWYGRDDLLQTRGYDRLEVRLQSLNQVKAVSSEIEALGFQVQSMQAVVDMANRVFAVVNTLLGSVGALALFVAGLGVANTMIMSVYERTREIGVLKALGASPGDVLRLFTVEASLIGFLGGLGGLVFGGVLAKLVDWGAHLYLEHFQRVEIPGPMSALPWWLALGALLFSTLVGFAAGIYPAGRAARLDPVQALRYE